MTGRSRPPLVALVLGVLAGGFCLVGGAWMVFVEGREMEDGSGRLPVDGWAVVWVGVAVGVMGAAAAMLQREVRRRRGR